MLPAVAGIVPNQTTLTRIEGGSTNEKFVVTTRAAMKIARTIKPHVRLFFVSCALHGEM
jgi:hypothetical protein